MLTGGSKCSVQRGSTGGSTSSFSGSLVGSQALGGGEAALRSGRTLEQHPWNCRSLTDSDLKLPSAPIGGHGTIGLCPAQGWVDSSWCAVGLSPRLAGSLLRESFLLVLWRSL